MAGKPLKVGVAGQGFGRHLLDTLLVRDDCVVAGVADHRDDRLAFARSRGLAVWGDAAAMIREADLDAVVLSSAPHVRGAALDAALEADVAVFMEKPIAGSPAQARAVAAVCEGARVMLGFSFRFHAPVQRLLEELPALGPPRLLNGEYLFDWLPDAEWLWNPEKGGGFFTENSCHLFDVLNAVMGPPEAVFAHGVDDGARPSQVGAAVSLRYSNGAAAALTLGGIRGSDAVGTFPRLDISCTDGRAELRGSAHMWTGLDWGARGADVRSLRHNPEGIARTRYSDAFDHFFANIAAGTSFAATPADAVAAVDLAAAIYQSMRDNRAVSLEEIQ